MKRIIVADDHELLRSGIVAILNNTPDLEVVGEANNGQAAVRLATTLQADIMLLDISMPQMNGLEVLSRLQEQGCDIKVMMITIFEDTSIMNEAIRRGARGFIPKSANSDEIMYAIETISRGQLYVHPTMTEKIFITGKIEPLDPCETLTPRELEVMKLIAKGNTNTQTAELLCISPRTVEYHRSNINSKLNLRGRIEFVEYAMKHKII